MKLTRRIITAIIMALTADYVQCKEKDLYAKSAYNMEHLIKIVQKKGRY